MAGFSLEDLKDFPSEAKKEAGYQLSNIQVGSEPSDWKPMTSVGGGVKKIRLHRENEYRVIYIAKFEERIYILHAFAMKTQKTSKKDIDKAKVRYKELIKSRRKS